ncbi:hypothetical protein F383_30166 [Gossypium arboreum]|uniref:Uncharacterized protein n=1 Tax=Gossypium arboreum TaxID=29729 RepID=A0A0B0PD12_GOSAR|nr:hypothetical protein F383_30166 [Gossypium arboreum]
MSIHNLLIIITIFYRSYIY